MIDKQQILKIAQENKLDFDFVELYVEEIEKIFQKHFCFSEKDIQKNINKIFETQSQEAVEYFFDIFNKYSQLSSSSKVLTQTEKFYRKKFAQDVVEKAFELYANQSRKIKDEFFVALQEAEKFGIDPYRISNKTTFKNLSKDSFLASLKALMQELYVDTNTMKEFRLFEKEEDLKAMFEECSSLACKFNSSVIQDVLELLSNFTYDQKNHVFYGNVNYVNMVRKCKKILTQSTVKLQETMDFLTKYFTDANDPATKQELVLKVNQDPTILLLSPEKVFSLEKALVAVGMPAEKAKAFCFNKNNLIQINGLSKENMSDLATLKVILERYLDENSVQEALSRFEFIKTKPIVLDVIFKRAIEEGVYANFLKRPSALSSITGEMPTSNPKAKDRPSSGKEKSVSFKPLDEAKILSDQEKASLQKELSRISAKDKEYIESVIDKLKGKEKEPDAEPTNRPDKGATKSQKPKKKRNKYIDDELLAKINEINSKANMSDNLKLLSIAELCLDKINGKDFCKRKYCSDAVRKNLERRQELQAITAELAGYETVKPFENIMTHMRNLMTNDCPFKATSKNFEEYYAPAFFKKNYSFAKSVADLTEKAAELTIKITNNNDKILNDSLGISKINQNKRAVYNYNHFFFNEGNLNISVIKMVIDLQKILKNDIDEVVEGKLLESVLSEKFDPTLPLIMFNVYKALNKLSSVEREALESVSAEKILDPTSQNYMSNFGSSFLEKMQYDKAFLRHKAILYCQVSMRNSKGEHRLDKKTNPDIFKIQSLEYDDEGIYLRFKENYTLFYPGAPTQEQAEKFRLSRVSEETKALPKVRMTQNQMFEDLDKLDNKIFDDPKVKRLKD